MGLKCFNLFRDPEWKVLDCQIWIILNVPSDEAMLLPNVLLLFPIWEKQLIRWQKMTLILRLKSGFFIFGEMQTVRRLVICLTTPFDMFWTKSFLVSNAPASSTANVKYFSDWNQHSLVSLLSLAVTRGILLALVCRFTRGKWSTQCI